MLRTLTRAAGKDLRTALIAVIAASAVMAAPAAASYIANADQVDHKDAVGYGASSAGRAGKLVATNSQGYLPNNILRKAPDAGELDGLDSTKFLRTMNQPFAVGKPIGVHPHPVPAKEFTLASVTVNAPAGGVVVLTGQAVFSANQAGGYMDVYLGVNTKHAWYTLWDAGDDDNFYDQHQEATAILPVSPGTHTYTLRVQEHAATHSDYYGESLIATYYPKGNAKLAAKTFGSTPAASPNR
jgi:hypothetical protein